MGQDKTKDLLLQTAEEMQAYCKKLQFSCFYGIAPGEQDKHIFWNLERDRDWRNFLELAKSLQVKVVYLNLTPFEEFMVDDALEGEEENIGEIESFRNKVGLIAIVDLAFLYEGFFHVYQASADWFIQFQALFESKEELGEEEIDPAVVHDWAEKLASEPRYGSCRNKSQRRYLLEELAGRNFEDLPELDILDSAEKIYFLKVKPKEDERLKEEARRLREQGLNLNAIAQKLGVTCDRVSGLLSN